MPGTVSADLKVADRAGRESDVVCQEARQFLDQFGEAVHELLALHEQQFQAVVQGDTNAHRFDLLIYDANERKRRAKYRYIGHLERHGCSDLHAAVAR